MKISKSLTTADADWGGRRHSPSLNHPPLSDFSQMNNVGRQSGQDAVSSRPTHEVKLTSTAIRLPGGTFMSDRTVRRAVTVSCTNASPRRSSSSDSGPDQGHSKGPSINKPVGLVPKSGPQGVPQFLGDERHDGMQARRTPSRTSDKVWPRGPRGDPSGILFRRRSRAV
jgi:hypothetical protein